MQFFLNLRARVGPREDKIFRSTVVRDIGSLRTSVDSLKLELQELKSSLSKCKCEGSHSDLDTCLLYIRLKNWSDEALNEALLKSKLNSNILAYDVIRLKPTPAFRVKIRKSTLYHALSHARENGCVVDLWRGTKSRWSPPTSHPQFSKNSQSQGSVKVSAWNCRGLATATPYLHRLLEGGSDIVILSEHWLWPFDLYKLDELHPSFSGFGRADSRLSETAHDKSRGCGGVGILWKKSLDVFPISAVDSDRICGIRLKKDDETWLSIIGAYLPCADLGGDYYRDTLVELESVISGSANLGPVVIAGDFNAKHLCKIADTVGWKKLWDHALDHGEACITSLRNLVRVVSYPKHAISSCPLCEASELDVPLPGHIIERELEARGSRGLEGQYSAHN